MSKNIHYICTGIGFSYPGSAEFMARDGYSRQFYRGEPGFSFGSDPVNNNVRVAEKMRQGDGGVSRFSVPPVDSALPPTAVNPTPEDEECDFSDVVLNYISKILMEEDVEEKTGIFPESEALQVAEKSFYDVIGEKYPEPDPPPQGIDRRLPIDPNLGVEGFLADYSGSGSGLWCPNWNSEASFSLPPPQFSVEVAACSGSSVGTVSDGMADSPDSTLRISDVFSDSDSVLQFKKGVEEASKFLPCPKPLFLDYASMFPTMKNEAVHFPEESRGKKNAFTEDPALQRGTKQTAIYTESTVRSKLFDDVLLCSGGKNESDLRKALQEVANKSISQNNQAKGSNNGGKSRNKKGGIKKKAVVDLRTLLTLCAQAVASDDRRTAIEFLRQIRENSSPRGDGMQRLAHYFAGGLEARMAGSGTQIYKALIAMPVSAVDLLKAYQLFLAACPFRKLSIFFANKTVWHVSEKASTLHIIDFGILYGYQWPCLMQRLSNRPDGPPKLRITGVDFPHPGFRPSERVEETGRRLANYAETFGVQFEFNAIAQSWETIRIEDLKLREDEVLAVNCLYRFRNLLDETVVANSPRNTVLNLIKDIKPKVFILGIVNGAYNAPFFVTRFREALFHYSSIFDMLETNIPRGIHERELLERTIFGREAMNVIACEGAERIERPETYKQWQVRNLRAGFRQLPLNEEIMRMSRERVKSYGKDFVIDEDSHWMLQGWKGRIVYALSSWRPAD